MWQNGGSVKRSTSLAIASLVLASLVGTGAAAAADGEGTGLLPPPDVQGTQVTGIDPAWGALLLQEHSSIEHRADQLGDAGMDPIAQAEFLAGQFGIEHRAELRSSGVDPSIMARFLAEHVERETRG